MDALVVLFVIALYWLPTLIAGARRTANGGGVAALNLLLGWTVLGWIVALVMALSGRRSDAVA